MFVNQYDLGMRRNFEQLFGKNRCAHAPAAARERVPLTPPPSAVSLWFRWLLPSNRPPPGDGHRFATVRDIAESSGFFSHV